MTAQIGDIYKYGKKEYQIVAMSAGIPFNPKHYGLETHPSCTACYRGYWCEYSVDDEKLVLKKLYLFNMDDNYPPLNGVEVEPQEFVEYELRTGKKKTLEKHVRPAHFGHRVYANLDMPIPYTGRILLGDGFMHEYYIHMGFQRAWAYKKLLEFVFDEGIAVECNDLSHMAKARRQGIKKRNENPRYPDGNIPKFIEESFSLDYSDKVWWEDD